MDLHVVPTYTHWFIFFFIQDQNDRLTFNVSHDEVTLEESYFFIERLFKKYGNKELLTYQNLEKIFWHLGIGEYIGPVEEQSHKGKHTNLLNSYTHISTNSTINLYQHIP